MKATGIVRRIDDLGRVVIPKEIRRTMRIREGDPLEIYTATDGEVIFKKYSPLGDFAEFTAQYSEVLHKALSLPVLITDRDRVISCSGIPKKDYIDRRISPSLEKIMDERKTYIAENFDNAIIPAELSDRKAVIAVPIIGMGDVSGSIVAMYNDEMKIPDQTDIKLCEVAAQFLGKQTED